MVNEEVLKSFFVQNIGCQVTDLKLHSKRGFAFVGFLNEKEAEKAIKLDGTRLKSAPLKIEECQDMKEHTAKKEKKNKEDNLPKSKKKADTKKNISEDNLENDVDKNTSVQLNTFLMSKVDPDLKDDEAELEDVSKNSKKSKKSSKKKSRKEMFAVQIRGMDPSAKSKDVKEFLNPIPCDFIQVKKNGSAIVFFSTSKHHQDALKRNRGFVGKKRVSVRFYNPTNEIETNKVPTNNTTTREFITSKSPEEIIEELQDTGRLFIRNLSYTCQEEDLLNLFTPYGKLTEVNLAYDNRIQQNKGFGFVSFMFPEHAIKAFQDLDKTIFMGRNLHIIPAHPRPDENNSDDGEEGGENDPSQFKNKREKQLKSAASSSYNWNTLFISPEAVATVLAEKQGVSKEEFVASKDKTGAAVRLALGETQLVLETKQFLESQGVHLDVFDNAASTLSRKIREKTGSIKQDHLSLTTFLAKNLPLEMTRDDLHELFGKFDGLKRCIMPPYGLTAIIEYKLPQQARAAFKALAYSKWQDKMILLEWAPLHLIISDEKSVAEDDSAQKKEELPETKSDKKGKRKRKLSNSEDNPTESKQPALEVHEATLSSTDDGTKKTNEYSKQNITEDPKIPQKTNQKKSNVVIVKNIAFQASRKEIESLFSPCGKIIAIRLPKKPTGDHRGFAFIEFSSVDDAEKTMETFGLSTHFYGRRLVIEYSAQENQSK